jgi:hypothetical protein
MCLHLQWTSHSTFIPITLFWLAIYLSYYSSICFIFPYNLFSIYFHFHGQASHQLGLSFKKHNVVGAQQYNSLKTSILQENTKFLDSAVSILAANCIGCSLCSLPCILQNQQTPNIYQRKLDMTDSKGLAPITINNY